MLGDIRKPMQERLAISQEKRPDYDVASFY